MATAASGPTTALAQWIAEKETVRGTRALRLATNAYIDICACLIAGSRDAATLRVANAAANWGSGNCSVVGQTSMLSAPAAALVNGTAAHALDFDDNFHPLAGHATAVLAPAIFAVAESIDASGLDVLDAYLIGLETQAFVGNAVNLIHYERGWHSTSTVGTFGAAAACARLQRLDARGVRAALSLASSMASGSKLQFGTMAKPMHAGLAAQHGVMAAALAASGVDGVAEPLDGEWSFRDLFAGEDSPGFSAKPIGVPLAIERYGLKAKIHPCCASAHCAIDALLDLRREHRFDPREVAAIEVLVNRVSHDNLRYRNPRTELEARFSMHWCMALALIRGKLELADFTPAALEREDIRAWLPRIAMRATEVGHEHPTFENGREPALTSVLLHDGRRLERYAQYPKGSQGDPLCEDELTAKFNDCAPGCNAVLATLTDLARLAGIRRLMTQLREANTHRR